MKICCAAFHRVYIISRAPCGHTPNDQGSGVPPLLRPAKPVLRIVFEGASAPSQVVLSRGICIILCQKSANSTKFGLEMRRIPGFACSLHSFRPKRRWFQYESAFFFVRKALHRCASLLYRVCKKCFPTDSRFCMMPCLVFPAELFWVDAHMNRSLPIPCEAALIIRTVQEYSGHISNCC